MIRHIVAIDKNLGIAKAGKQPWHLPGDSAYFNEQTNRYGGAILMGRKTYEVIGHLLKGRKNYIVTRQTDKIPGAIIVNDLASFIKTISTDIWIIGGAAIYAETLSVADELYVTKIAANFDCDQAYPAYEDQFKLVSESDPQIENEISYTYCVYTPRLYEG